MLLQATLKHIRSIQLETCLTKVNHVFTPSKINVISHKFTYMFLACFVIVAISMHIYLPFIEFDHSFSQVFLI